MTDLRNKVAIVTGSSRGIGRGIAERFGMLGANVVVNYFTSKEKAADAVHAIKASGGRAVAVQADVSKVEDVARLFRTAVETFGTVDIVVANAGIAMVGKSVLDFTESDFDTLCGVNLKGAFFTMQHAAKFVADGGRIIFVGSSTTNFPMPAHSLYGTTKMAPRFLVEAMAKELGPRGITVNTLLPSVTEGAGIHTDGLLPAAREFVERTNPQKRAGTIKDSADVAEFLVSDKAGFVSGQHILAAGGAPA